MAVDRLKKVRGLLTRFSTPLLPDDYTGLINPLWSTNQLRGKIISVKREGDCIHLAIEPGWGVPTHFRAGQFIGIGVLVDGRYTWRSYSLTNAPKPGRHRLEVTVRAVEKGKLSNHLVGTATPGTTVRLLAPAGDFHLSDPPPEKVAFIVGGTGITPVISMLRTMEERGQFHRSDVVLIYSVHDLGEALFRAELEKLAETQNFRVIFRETRSEGRLGVDKLEQALPDFQERDVYACGPAPMLDWIEEWAKERGVPCHTERFTLDRASGAKGGVVSFSNGVQVRVDGAATLLEAGESAGVNMPFGCRMGLCHTCVRPLNAGHAVNLTTGETHEPGTRVRTCVCVAAGDVEIGI